MNGNDIASRVIAKDEGCRLEPYKDSLGWWTVGVGHLIDRRKGGVLPAWMKPSFPLEQAEVDQLLKHDIRGRESTLDISVPWWRGLSDVRRAVLLSMAFQLGTGGLLKFMNMLRAAEKGQWAEAAEGMRHSLWYRQTPARAERLAKAMETDDEAALELG